MVSKDVIKALIAEFQREIAGVKLVERPCRMEDSLSYVLVGLRRSGKSYMLFQQIRSLLKKGLSPNEILYFNFEDDRLGKLETGDLDLIKSCYEEMFDSRPIFFLDEIQVVEGWEKFARRLADHGYRVYITGSNAKMLSSEIASTLGGRYMIRNVYPYSFGEYLRASGIDMGEKNAALRHKAAIDKAFETYFRFGGMPEVLRVDGKREWLSNLYQKLFFGDIVARYQIRNDFALRVLIRKLAESVKQPSSFSRMANLVSASGKKITTDTVIDYLGYLRDSWLIFSIENWAAKLAEKESNRKYYFVDNGLLQLFLFDPQTALLENLVAIQLKQQYGDEVYFYHNGVEVDFYIPEHSLAIQACYSLHDAETRKRELNALSTLSKRLEVKRALVITKDEEENIQHSDLNIEVVPIKKWLMA